MLKSRNIKKKIYDLNLFNSANILWQTEFIAVKHNEMDVNLQKKRKKKMKERNHICSV